MAGYRMSISSVRQLQSGMMSTVDQLRGDLDTLEAKLNVLQQNWDGDASAAYAEAQQRWNESLARLTRLLERAAVANGRVVDRHLESRAKVASLWR